ncbi:hypothetical protein [Pseudoxanthomonas sp. 10H]|uniref:hypothetical protein n=1 Tax=Pseudoxanthomonas sp. 10H TaxID=3242729 RepID=UPI00355696F3
MRVEARPRARFFLAMGVLFLAVALAGFTGTYFVPLARRSFSAPAVVHVHGALLFGWLLLFIAQAWRVRQRRMVQHRRWGWFGAGLCVAIMASGVGVGLFATRRDLAAGGGDFALGQFVNILVEMLLFGALVGAAVAMRRDGESHKRLLLLATISALAPAWLRFRHFLPGVPHPFVTFSIVADTLLLVAIARDWLMLRRVHPVYLWAGGAMVAVHAIELLAITSAPWTGMARWLLGVSG